MACNKKRLELCSFTKSFSKSPEMLVLLPLRCFLTGYLTVTTYKEQKTNGLQNKKRYK